MQVVIHRQFVALFAALVLSPNLSAFAGPAAFSLPQSLPPNVSDRGMVNDGNDWLLRFDTGAELPGLPDLERILTSVAGQEVELQDIPLTNGVRIRLADPLQQRHVRSIVETVAPVRWLEPNYPLSWSVIPNDPEFDQQWGFRNVGQTINSFADPADCDAGESCFEDPGQSGIDVRAADAWNVTLGDAAIRVAVIDTGIDRAHPDFGSNLFRNGAETENGSDDDGNGYVDDIYGWDACDSDGDPQDLIGHGTEVAGVIGAVGNDGFGIAGMAWNVELVPIRSLGPMPQPADSDCNLTSGALIALDYALQIDADIVNMSWGGPEGSQALQDKIAELADAGIVLIAASGNEGIDLDSKPFYPASYRFPEVLSVGAHTNDGNVSSFSNVGDVVSLTAPGVNIRTVKPAYEDGWSEANFDAATVVQDGARRLDQGPVDGTDFSVVESDAKWGIAELSDGQSSLVAIIGDFQDGDPAEWSAHTAGLDQTLSSTSFDASAWGSAVLRFGVVHDLGSGAEFRLQYSVGGGSWRSLPDGLGVYEGFGAAEDVFDIGAVAGNPLPTDLRIRFRLQTSAEHTGSTPGGLYLYQVRWIRPGTDYSSDVHAFVQGTSLAAPFAAGAAALVMANAPGISAADVVRQLVYRSDRLSVTNPGYPGGFRLNAAKALELDPILVWTRRPGYEADGVSPNPVPVATPVTFEARLLDPAEQAGTISEAVLKHTDPGGAITYADLSIGGDGRFATTLSFDEEGTHSYRFLVTATGGQLGGVAARTKSFVVGTSNNGGADGGSAGGEADSLLSEGGGGCGCRVDGQLHASAIPSAALCIFLFGFLFRRFFRRIGT